MVCAQDQMVFQQLLGYNANDQLQRFHRVRHLHTYKQAQSPSSQPLQPHHPHPHPHRSSSAV
eukprot:1157550-Pelagomonas_calceolata.AAC.6